MRFLSLFSLFMIVATVAITANRWHAYSDRVCGGTANVAMCDLSLQAGNSDRVARDAGNGIYGEGR